nr:MPF=megakaryocyte potentiating factor {N-terminal} [human, pancreatic tumor cell line HPC-Y5, Peptide Partial, 18 aa] [Homo sapiens]
LAGETGQEAAPLDGVLAN